MIYQSYNFVDSYANASGNRRNNMVLGELGKLIKTNPEMVINALEEAEINVPRNVTSKGLTRIILSNKRNTRMVRNLSALIFASTSFSGSEYSNVDGEKGEFFKNIGSWFKNRKERKAQSQKGNEPKERGRVFKKIGNFFRNNQEEIGEIGTTLSDSLRDRQAISSIESNTQPTDTTNTQDQSWFEKNKTPIIVFGLVALVVGGYFIINRKK